jgi:hypothetical protein
VSSKIRNALYYGAAGLMYCSAVARSIPRLFSLGCGHSWYTCFVINCNALDVLILFGACFKNEPRGPRLILQMVIAFKDTFNSTLCIYISDQLS